MVEPRTYPNGVPCWVDVEHEDLDAATDFYGGLFGWSFEPVTPTYRIARLAGQDVAAVGAGDQGWSTYVAVDDASGAAEAVRTCGGSVLVEPADAGPGGRLAMCADPGGARFRLWQARRRLGAQLVNAPGAWNFSDLHTPDPPAALAFYTAVFGWVAEDMGKDAGMMVRVPGYGAHLAATSDPDIYQRQAAAPPGFADVIGSLVPAAGEQPYWHVTLSVGDRDGSAATVERLGGSVLSTSQTIWARRAHVRDPQGAEFSISQFTPPDGF
jgi:uncharacterized protein